jgi:hypothetical protein
MHAQIIYEVTIQLFRLFFYFVKVSARSPNHGFTHTLMDYNNAQTTTHRDILNVLALAEDRISKEMSRKIDKTSHA